MKLILGSAQFGLHYGINNKIGILDQEQINDILDYAHSKGIDTIDTAFDYGDALKVLGGYPDLEKYKVISKIKCVAGKVNELFDKTLELLNLDSLYCLMFHNASDIATGSNKLDFVNLKDTKKIEKIGVSVYSNAEFEMAIDDTDVDIIQFPYNLLDNYSKRGRLIIEAKKRNKILHSRSTYLQGVFFLDVIPPYLDKLTPSLTSLKNICDANGIAIGELAINYVTGNQYIDNTVIGVDSLEHLKSNLLSIKKVLTKEAEQEVDSINVQNLSLLNPSQWKLKT